MADLNKIVLIGRLTRDPDLRFIPDGTPVCSFSVAVNRAFKGRDGSKEVDFINITTWRGLAERCGKYLKKGSQVGLTGRLQIRNYELSSGEKRRDAEVIADNVQFLDKVRGIKQDQSDAHFADFTPPRADKAVSAKPPAAPGSSYGPASDASFAESSKGDVPDGPFEDDDLGIDPDDIPF